MIYSYKDIGRWWKNDGVLHKNRPFCVSWSNRTKIWTEGVPKSTHPRHLALSFLVVIVVGFASELIRLFTLPAPCFGVQITMLHSVAGSSDSRSGFQFETESNQTIWSFFHLQSVNIGCFSVHSLVAMKYANLLRFSAWDPLGPWLQYIVIYVLDNGIFRLQVFPVRRAVHEPFPVRLRRERQTVAPGELTTLVL